ncbi:MAG: RNA ligase (ATP) [Gemmatimonadetes bacterium]|nr:RNA ligase (ATP) [Gemmatimonadota bacterium]
MSTFEAPVVAYRSVPHPNADALELALINDWRAAVRIGVFAEGQPVAYIPEGALCPQDLVEELGLADPPRLAGPDHNRVKAVRLRGVLSQGLVYGGPRIAGLEIGDNAADALGLVKWVPEIPVHMAGLMAPGPQITYDIDNIKSWPDRFLPGEEVAVTEKLHGTFCCMGRLAGGEYVVSSKGHLSAGRVFDLAAAENIDNLYVKMMRHYTDFGSISMAQDHVAGADIFLFGEIIGPKVQDLNYDQPEPAFMLFDIRTPRGYMPYDSMLSIADHVGLPVVPELFRGRWNPTLVDQFTSGRSRIAPHHREGVVIRPLIDRYDSGVDHESGRGPGRVMFKSVSEKHLLRKGGTEYN